MKKVITCLYSNYLGCYDIPQFLDVRDDDDLKESYRRMVINNPDEAFKYRVHEKTLCKLGFFDDFTGKIELLDAPIKLLDLASLFPQGYLARKESING